MRHKNTLIVMGVALCCVVVIAYTNYMEHRNLTVNPATYAPLLDVIAKAESKGNYNAYFGVPTNSSVDFTRMSIAQVIQWQRDFLQQGNASSAVGRYQIIDSTLSGLVRQLGVDTAKPFDAHTQDMFAIALLERRGALEYVNNEITAQQFAANLAKEWAGLPKVIGSNPDQSYYENDGLNVSRVGIDEVLGAIEPISSH